VGIIPQKLYEKVEDLAVSKLIVVDTMHQRKSAMFEHAEGFIALPGGIGTLEEFSEVFTWLQLGYSTKPVGLLNADNYFTKLLDFLDVMVANDMLKEDHKNMLAVSSSAGEILDKLSNFKPAYFDKWNSY
ncbi:MAG: TIGR00730 family Rossman fold protein, partial [Spirochaetes bacterium]|nr:TIGR00730 family Rossman fold protein [Spirochaetota bacterium]